MGSLAAQAIEAEILALEILALEILAAVIRVAQIEEAAASTEVHVAAIREVEAQEEADLVRA